MSEMVERVMGPSKLLQRFQFRTRALRLNISTFCSNLVLMRFSSDSTKVLTAEFHSHESISVKQNETY